MHGFFFKVSFTKARKPTKITIANTLTKYNKKEKKKKKKKKNSSILKRLSRCLNKQLTNFRYI